MQRLEQHTITKIINKSGVTRDYYCNQYNTHYPSINLVLENHPKFDQSKFTIFDKRNGQVHETPEQTTNNHPPTKGNDML